MWSVENDSSLTWHCMTYKYVAEEKENRATECPFCGFPRHYLLLKDADGFHRWCIGCRRLENTEERF